VVFADDDYLIPEGSATLLAVAGSLDVVAIAIDRDSLLSAVDEHRPDSVLTDIRMPPSFTREGIQAARQIRADHPEIGVVVLSQHVCDAYLEELFADGAAGLGYLLKDIGSRTWRRGHRTRRHVVALGLLAGPGPDQYLCGQLLNWISTAGVVLHQHASRAPDQS
jgi:DNA-binding NarL/FixJ family response regulator